MRSPKIVLLVGLALLTWRPPAGTAAAPGRAKQAVTDINAVDADYAFQGEYVGTYQALHSSWWRRAGLQVVARGDGKFDGVLYSGGLPGDGWDRGTRLRLTGERTGGVTLLRGESLVITTDGTNATVQDEQGAAHGQLEKVHRESPTLGAAPPANALVLFDGSSVDQFDGGRMTPDGLLEVGPRTKLAVGDFRLHVEFRTPYMPYATGQGRGNSGVYIQERYEVQVLDSFGMEGVENECGAIYRQHAPEVNMCLPPLTWQTYDIWFTAARWDADGQKRANARITLVHNGVVVQRGYELPNKTGAGKPEGPERLAILFQNHGNPVHFRNLWIVDEPLPSAAAGKIGRKACFPRIRALLCRLRCRR